MGVHKGKGNLLKKTNVKTELNTILVPLHHINY